MVLCWFLLPLLKDEQKKNPIKTWKKNASNDQKATTKSLECVGLFSYMIDKQLHKISSLFLCGDGI